MRLKRNRERVLSALSTLPNESIVTKEKLSILFPVRFREINFAIIGETTHCYGLFAMVVGEEYALLNINTYVELGKAKVSKIVVGGQDYYKFDYEPGDVVIKTTEVVARANLIFTALDEFLFKGKIPFYVSYHDGPKLFLTAEKYAGTKAKMYPATVAYLFAYIARKKGDRQKFMRDGAKSRSDFDLDKLSWVPLRSVYWSAPGTLNKTSGAYFDNGVVAALVNPSDTIGPIEEIVRA